MIPVNMESQGPRVREGARKPLSETDRCENAGDKIICLSLAPEDEYGYSELQFHERGIISTNISLSEDDGVGSSYSAPNATLPGDNPIEWRDDIVYFDHEIIEKLELYQTGPLRQVAHITVIAIHWWALRTQESLEESLMMTYSQLRNIESILVAVDHHPRQDPADNACHQASSPLSIYQMPHDTILE